MDPQEVFVAALRGCHLLMLISLVGTLVSLVLVVPSAPALAGASLARSRLINLARWSDGMAVLIGIAWLIVQAATMTSTSSIRSVAGAVVEVSHDTRFGHLEVLRVGLLLAVFPLIGGRRWRLSAALVLAGVALSLQGGVAHAAATGGTTGFVLLLVEALHLLAAGAWLGGLLPLLLLIQSLPRQAAVIARRNFSPVGLGAVLVIGGTAMVQGVQWIGGLGGLFGTAYGHIALLKLMLFAVLLCLASLNRVFLSNGCRPKAARSGDRYCLRPLQVKRFSGPWSSSPPRCSPRRHPRHTYPRSGHFRGGRAWPHWMRREAGSSF